MTNILATTRSLRRAPVARYPRGRVAVFVVVTLCGGVTAALESASAATPTTKSPAAAAKPTATKPASARSVTAESTVAKGSATRAQAAKAAKIVQPGKNFVGWDKRTASDWPASDSAVILEPMAQTILVRKSPNYETPGILLGSGTSVSGSLGLLVVGESAGWWKVLLPVRPNGTVGWVEASTANARLVRERIVVDLAANSLTLLVNGKVARTESVATGTSGTPTPDGLFFVKSIVPQANPAGGRGPFVLVLSAFSNVLNSFDGGQGAVGIHGTSAPGKLGQDISHGCVRTRNDTIVYFAKNLRTGTPVEIHGSAGRAPTSRWSTPEAVLKAPNGLLVPTAVATSKTPANTGPSTTVGTGDKPTTQPTTSVPDGNSGGVESAKPPITGLPG